MGSSNKNQNSKNQNNEVARTLGVGAAKPRRALKRWLVAVVLLLVAGALFALWSSREGAKAVQFKTDEARRGDLVVTVTATGNLQPTNQVEVGSELSGIVKTVEVDYNDRVSVGQVLARLDTSKLAAQVAQSKAALEGAQAKVLQVQATVRESSSQLQRLQRVRRLSRQELPSQEELDAAEATLQRAQADEVAAKAAVLQAQATLEANQTELSKTTIRSPIDGIVLTRNVEPGQTVAASLQAPVLFTLAEDLSKMELHVDVDEADVGQVEAGQEATFSVDAYPNRRFPASITQVRYGAKIVGGVVTYETVLKVDNSDLSLRPGMTATADITVRQLRDVLLVPNTALRFEPPVQEQDSPQSGGILRALLPHPPRSLTGPRRGNAGKGRRAQVWVLRDGQPVAIPVTTGATDGTSTEITAGEVQPGTALLVDTVSPPR